MAGKLSDQDRLIYAVVAVIAVGIGVTWYGMRTMVRRAEGRDVQALLTKTNFATDASYQKQAKTYVRELIRNGTLAEGQREAAEEIYAKAFKANMTGWVEGRLHNESDAAANARKRAVWDECYREIDALKARK